jgi:hypothetical protein
MKSLIKIIGVSLILGSTGLIPGALASNSYNMEEDPLLPQLTLSQRIAVLEEALKHYPSLPDADKEDFLFKHQKIVMELCVILSLEENGVCDSLPEDIEAKIGILCERYKDESTKLHEKAPKSSKVCIIS